MKVFLALGANVGDKEENIKRAVELLEEKVQDVAMSKIYKTKPVGFTDQDNFFNAVIGGLTNLSPEELLKFGKNIELEVGRIKRFQNGPREIDIDILFYDNLIVHQQNLSIPHLDCMKEILF